MKTELMAVMLTSIGLAAPSSAKSANTIPIELQGDRPPILAVQVNGMDVRLRFDLGDGTALVLQQSVLDSIRAVPTGESAKMQGIDGSFEAPLFRVARVQLGTVVFTDVVARLDTDRLGYKPDESTKGFLGTGLLKPYKVVIDYPRHAMTLLGPTSKEFPDSCTGTPVPFSMRSPTWSGEAFTEVETDLGRMILAWDTGAFTSVLRKAFVQGARPDHTAPTLITKQFIVGGRNFGPKQFEVWDLSLPEFDGLIGNDFFATHVVCVDFPAKRLRISPPKDGFKPAATPPARSVPLATCESNRDQPGTFA